MQESTMNSLLFFIFSVKNIMATARGANVYKLIYKSRSRRAIDRETLRDILYTSLDMNRKNLLTGALLASRTHYLQILEGAFADVNETFSRIVKDPRHTDLELISFNPCHKRLFEKWMMKGFGLFDLNKEMERRLIEKYGEEENGVFFPREEHSSLALIHEVRMLSREQS